MGCDIDVRITFGSILSKGEASNKTIDRRDGRDIKDDEKLAWIEGVIPF